MQLGHTADAHFYISVSAHAFLIDSHHCVPQTIDSDTEGKHMHSTLP